MVSWTSGTFLEALPELKTTGTVVYLPLVCGILPSGDRVVTFCAAGALAWLWSLFAGIEHHCITKFLLRVFPDDLKSLKVLVSHDEFSFMGERWHSCVQSMPCRTEHYSSNFLEALVMNEIFLHVQCNDSHFVLNAAIELQ